MAARAHSERILDVQDLRTHFFSDDGAVKAVDGVSFHLDRGETLAVVGESGSGKSVTSLSLMRLIPPRSGRIVGGRILFGGRDIAKLSEAEMCRLRGIEISMIFQEPMTSLTPVHTVGAQIAEAIEVHQRVSRRLARSRAIDMIELVGIPEGEKRARNFPHQLSGGMRQRVMIAMALACSPKLLIADEPTTGLDVTIQAQILDLMRKLQREIGMSILFITHDLGVVAEMADRVVVMYAGRAVEEAEVREIFKNPRMPYTLGLMNSIPRVDRAARQQARLHPIAGNVPNPRALPPGCSFHPRCRFMEAERCAAEVPKLDDSGAGHMVRCVRWHELDLKSEMAMA
jgi:oligopeptide/dipeptide ABC transporter ATP-binding protein